MTLTIVKAGNREHVKLDFCVGLRGEMLTVVFVLRYDAVITTPTMIYRSPQHETPGPETFRSSVRDEREPEEPRRSRASAPLLLHGAECGVRSALMRVFELRYDTVITTTTMIYRRTKTPQLETPGPETSHMKDFSKRRRRTGGAEEVDYSFNSVRLS
ncbi:hypothetical protein SRHO_G00190780 [Serrasalmus rhombeus]